jgi:hypothetical protein
LKEANSQHEQSAPSPGSAATAGEIYIIFSFLLFAIDRGGLTSFQIVVVMCGSLLPLAFHQQVFEKATTTTYLTLPSLTGQHAIGLGWHCRHRRFTLRAPSIRR